MAAGRVYRTSTVQYLQRPAQNREDVNPLLEAPIDTPLDVAYASGGTIDRQRSARLLWRPWPYTVNRQTRPRVDVSEPAIDTPLDVAYASGSPISRARAARDRMRPWPYLVNRQNRARIDQSASGDATVPGSTINVLTEFPVMAVSVDDTTTPTTIAVPTTFGSTTVTAGSTPTPTRINVLTSFGTPTETVSATTAPATIAVPSSFGAPTVVANPSPALINVLTTFGAPSVSGTPAPVATPSTIDVRTTFGTQAVLPSDQATAFTFEPPTTEQSSANENDRETWDLARHYRPQLRGVNVYKLVDGSFTEQQPARNIGVVREYLGGHKHPITVAERDELVAAGYASNIT